MNEHTLSSLITSYMKPPECQFLPKYESNLSRASHQHLHLVCLVFNKTIKPLFDDLIQANAFGNHLSSHVQPTVRQCLDHLLEVTLLVRGNAHVALFAEDQITWEERASFLPDGNVDMCSTSAQSQNRLI